jgi:hypothetical protein
MKIGIVSTFSEQVYMDYAEHFVDSLKNNLDKSIEIFLYVDNVSIKTGSNINILNLEQSVPDLVNFKIRNKDKTFGDFLRDAVRFSHKSYAIWHAAMNSKVDILIWLDADTEIIKAVSSDYLKSFLPDNYFTSYLGRDKGYTETGFIAFDLRHPCTNEFFDIFKNYYDSDKIYTLKEYTDCHVFDATRKELENLKKITGYNLTPGNIKNPFNNTFKGYMVHLKGGKKDQREKIISKSLKGTK